MEGMVNTRLALKAQKSWLPFVLTAFVLSMSFDPATKAYDENFRTRPFMKVILKLEANGENKPTVVYAAWSDVFVEGRWSGWVSVNGRRTCGGSGASGYGPPAKPAEDWEWADWLGVDCELPEVPFKLCVRYPIKTASGVGDVSGPFCSQIFDPKGNHNVQNQRHPD